MGRDKALISFLGRTLIERVISRVGHMADEILVTTNRPADYAFLGVDLYPDVIPNRGALGGLYTALYAASQPLVAVVACDMPFVSPQILTCECDLLVDPKLAAAIPKLDTGTEPFHAVYRRSACLPAILDSLQKDLWRVDSWFSQANIHFLSPKEIAVCDPEGLAFQNVNTPEELARAEQIARQRL